MPTTIISRLALFICSALLVTPTPALALDASAPGGKAPPKLVLFMVVDGFPQEQLVKYYDQYGERGLKLFLDGGLLAAQQTAVNFDLLFTFAALLHAAFLAREVRPLASQAWQIILNLSQFNL